MTLLSVQDLQVTLPTVTGAAPIVDRVSFQVGVGESVGIVGESGCGKSMTALAIMGLLPMSAQVAGSIRLQDRELVGLAERDYCRVRGQVAAMIFQEPMTALNPLQTIGAQIGEGLRVAKGWSRRAVTERVRELLERVGLPTPRYSPDLYPHQLSGGQRQRVGIAIALACEPRLLIADEPTTALDVTIQAQILDLLLEIIDADGMGLILISHDLGVIAETTDRMYVMYAGHVVEEGTTAQVFAGLTHPYSRGLFQAMPQASGGGGDQRLATIPGVVPEPSARPLGCVFADRCFQVAPRCREAFPAVRSVAGDHRSACYFPLDVAPA